MSEINPVGNRALKYSFLGSFLFRCHKMWQKSELMIFECETIVAFEFRLDAPYLYGLTSKKSENWNFLLGTCWKNFFRCQKIGRLSILNPFYGSDLVHCVLIGLDDGKRHYRWHLIPENSKNTSFANNKLLMFENFFFENMEQTSEDKM